MNRRERRQAKFARTAQLAASAGPESPPPTEPASRRWRAILSVAAVCFCATAAAYLWLPAPLTATRAEPKVIEGDGVKGPRGMMWVPGGEFLMGSDHKLAQRNERPAHKVRVRGFWMDKTHVTNAQFAAFVKATGYVTTAERKPDWETLKVQLPPGTPKPPESALVPGAMVFVGTEKPVPLND